NMVIQSLVQPRFVGDSVGLSATVTFVALIFWAWVLGGLGALLAIPMTLLVKALLVDTDPRASWVDALIRSPDRSKKPVGDPPEAGAAEPAAAEPGAAEPAAAGSGAAGGAEAGSSVTTVPRQATEALPPAMDRSEL
ncbi:MAG TPA: AI-2E family transporter, partial [Pseudonocardia sp.]